VLLHEYQRSCDPEAVAILGRQPEGLPQVIGLNLGSLLQIDPRLDDLPELITRVAASRGVQEPLQGACAHDWPAQIPQIRVGPVPIREAARAAASDRF
jgi:hypothetical protein